MIPRDDRVVLPTTAAAICLGMCAVMPFPGELMALVALDVALLLVVTSTRVRSSAVLVPLAALPFMMWLTLSFTWSLGPVDTLLAATKSWSLLAVAVVIGWGRSTRDLADVLSRGAKVVLVASLLVALAVPSVGRTQEAYERGSFEGLFVHRNLLGYFAVLATVTFAVQALRARESGFSRLLHVLWSGFGVVMLIAAKSRTGWVVAVVVVLFALTLSVIGRMRAPRTTLASTVAVILGLMVLGLASQYATLASSLGRDPTLTGRTSIWAAVLGAIEARPTVGYGWGAVWLKGSPLAARLAQEVGFTFYHSHNGFLDVALQVGVVGAAAAVGFLVVVLLRAVSDFLARPSVDTGWPLLILGAVIIYNLSETVAFTNVGWLLLVLIYMQQAKERRARRRPSLADESRHSAGKGSPVLAS